MLDLVAITLHIKHHHLMKSRNTKSFAFHLFKEKLNIDWHLAITIERITQVLIHIIRIKKSVERQTNIKTHQIH